jgi:hypothetical protein
MALDEEITASQNEGEQNANISLSGEHKSTSAAEPQISNINEAQPISEQPSESKAEEPTPNPRLQALQQKKANLESTLSTLQAQKAALVTSTTLPSGLAMPESWTEEEKTKSALATANATIKEHISLLHKYNEIKDIAQGLMGLIAESRGVRVKVVMEEYEMGEGD